MGRLYELKMRLIEELEKLGGQDLSSGTLKTIDTLAHAIKNICKIMEDSDYSNSYRGGSYRGGSYDSSYRRDSMGRYASENGYSRNDAIVAKIAQMANNAPDERTRRQLQELAKELETE